MGLATAGDRIRTEKTVDRDRLSVIVYVFAAASVGVLLLAGTWQGAFSTDAYAHVAVIRELSSHLLDPQNPYVVSGDAAHYFSPYLVALGAVGQLSSTAPVTGLVIGSALNFALLATGLWMFSRSFSSFRWTPHLTLLFALLAWGVDPWPWSGFMHLGVLGQNLGLPSMFATGLALIALAGLCRYLETRQWTLLVLLAIAAAVVALTHVFTAIWTALAAVAIIASQPMRRVRSLAPGLVAGSIVAGAIVLAWPYYSVIDVVLGASDRSEVHDIMYQNVLQRSFLLIPAFVAMAYRARRSPRDPLVLMFLAALAVYAVGFVADSHGLGRVLPLIALTAHVALADLVAGWLSEAATRRTAVILIGVISAVGVYATLPAVPRMLPHTLNAPIESTPGGLGGFEPYQSLADTLGADAVVIGTQPMNMVVPSIVGRVVVPGHLTPLLTDRPQRDGDVARFFSDESSVSERTSIAEAWNATHIVVQPSDVARYPWLDADYERIGSTDVYVVFGIPTAP